MTRNSKTPLHQLERQARLTLVLLPLVSELSWFDSEPIAQTFGQAMSQLNFVAANRFATPGELPVISRPKTKEDLRTYNREYKRARRRRLKIEKLEKERQAIADRINQIRREA